MYKMPAAYYLFIVLSLVFLGFPCGSAGRESTCNAGDLGSIPGLGRSPGEGKGYPLYYSGLENSMNCIVMGSQRVGHDWETFTHLLLYYCEYKYTGWASVGSRAHSRAFPHMAGVPSVLALPHEGPALWVERKSSSVRDRTVEFSLHRQEFFNLEIMKIRSDKS